MDARPGAKIGLKRVAEARAARDALAQSSEKNSTSASSVEPPPQRPVKRRATRKHIGLQRLAEARAAATAARTAAEANSENNDSTFSNSSNSNSSSDTSSNLNSSSNSNSNSSSDSNSSSNSNTNFNFDSESENTSSEFSDDESNTVINEETPQIFAASGDPNLPHILKIGQEGYAEYIDLGSMPTRKEGINANQFNQFQIGNRLIELQKMYNVIGKDNIIAMQRAFGVRSLHEDPPIVKNIQDGCLPDDFKLVQKALQYRIETLKSRLGFKGQEFSSKSDERRLKWIQDILEKSKGIKVSCSKNEKEIQTTKPEEISTKSTAECACLSDMNLLRDLVYIVGLLQSITNPEVKKQLEGITLKRLLASARNSTASPPKNILQDIIDYLEKNIDKLNSENNSNKDEQELLRSIYNSIMMILDRDQVPEDVSITLEMILNGLRDIWAKMSELQKGLDEAEYDNEELKSVLDEYIFDLNGAQREIEAGREALDASQEKVQELMGVLNEYDQEIDRLNDTIRSLRDKMEQQTIDYQSGINQLMEFNEEQRERIQNYYDNFINAKNRLISELTEENEDLRNQLERLTTLIEKLNNIIQKHNDEIKELNLKLENEKNTSTVTTELLEKFRKRLEECDKDKEGLRTRLAEAEAARILAEDERNAAIRERNSVAEERNTVTDERNTALVERNTTADERNAALMERDESRASLETIQSEKTVLERELEELRGRLQSLQGDVGTRQARINILEAEIADLRNQLQALTTEQQEQRRKCEEDMANKNKEIIELTELKNTQIVELERRLEELTGQLTDKNKLLEQKNAQIEANEDEIKRLRDSVSAAEETGEESARQVINLTGENTKLKAELASLREKLMAKTDELTALTAKHDDVKKRLENILNLLLIDPRLREIAQRFMDGEGSADSPPSELKGVSAELCTFFQYLTNVVNLQMRKLISSALSAELKRDILGIYAEPTNVNPEELLKELTIFFQQVFTYISQSKTVQPEGFYLQGTFPLITSVFGMPVRDNLRTGLPKVMFLNDLNTFGFLSKVIIEPSDENILLKKIQNVGLLSEFIDDNSKKITPLVILGIKYIQLLATVLNTKYSDIAHQCGFSAETPIVAVESEPEEIPVQKPTAPVSIAVPSREEKLLLDAIERGDYNTLKTLERVISTQTDNLVRAKISKDINLTNRLTNNLKRLLGQYKNLYNYRGKVLPSGGPSIPRDININSKIVRSALDVLLGEKQRKSEEIDQILQAFLDDLLAIINKFKK